MSPSCIVDPRGRGIAYDVLRKLGEGAFATCYLVKPRHQRRDANSALALKRFPRSCACDDAKFAKIYNEVRIHERLSGGLRHPNIVCMFSAFDSERGDICMLLEYCPQGNLADFVERMEGSSLSESESIRFLKQLLSAVDHIHSVHNILHRDIKPSNVLLSATFSVKLADFGLACTMEENKRRLSVCGTPNYVAPEIITHRGHTFASDYWALACTFYFMLCGTTPFQTPSIERTYDRICQSDYDYPENFCGSRRSKDFIARVLCVEPSRRLTMREMREHPVFHIVRRLSVGNVLTLKDSNANYYSDPIMKPLSRCHSMFDVNNNHTGNSTGSSSKSPTDYHMLTEAFFCRALQSLISGSDWSDYGLRAADLQLPDTYVAKWVDYTNRYGFGTMLRNGVRSVIFDDDSVLSTIDCQNYLFHPVKTHRSCTIWNQQDALNQSVENKMQAARLLRNYMDNELNSSVPLCDADEFSTVELCRNSYVMDVIKLEDAVVFLICDGDVQINFTTLRLKIFLQRVSNSVHVHVVSSHLGVSSYLLDESVNPVNWPDRVPPPVWVEPVLDVMQSVMEHRSLAKHSTKC